MMSWSLKLAFVLGICAVSATAKSVQMEDVSKITMTAEENDFFTKMVTVIMKAQAMSGLQTDAALFSPVKRAVTADGDCSVSGDVGTCCGFITVPIDLFFVPDVDLDACLTVDYIPENYGVHLKLVINGDTIVNQEVSAVNPPAACYGVATFLTVCLKLSDIQIGANGSFHACFELIGRVFFVDVANLHLGCLDF